MTTSTLSQSSLSYESIKLGIDAHAKYSWESRQVVGATPQRRASVWIVMNGETKRLLPRCGSRRWTKSGNAR
jgi:hypothetical protein